jgi:hypothetical protein
MIDWYRLAIFVVVILTIAGGMVFLIAYWDDIISALRLRRESVGDEDMVFTPLEEILTFEDLLLELEKEYPSEKALIALMGMNGRPVEKIELSKTFSGTWFKVKTEEKGHTTKMNYLLRYIRRGDLHQIFADLYCIHPDDPEKPLSMGRMELLNISVNKRMVSDMGLGSWGSSPITSIEIFE